MGLQEGRGRGAGVCSELGNWGGAKFFFFGTETPIKLEKLTEKGPFCRDLGGPISRDIAILSLRYPISRDTL